jgi:hypothetical protein
MRIAIMTDVHGKHTTAHHTEPVVDVETASTGRCPSRYPLRSLVDNWCSGFEHATRHMSSPQHDELEHDATKTIYVRFDVVRSALQQLLTSSMRSIPGRSHIRVRGNLGSEMSAIPYSHWHLHTYPHKRTRALLVR